MPRLKEVTSSLESAKKQSYLEIHIEEDGKLKFTPLTRNTASVAKALSGKADMDLSVYCG
ncbi:MAG: hypothetical protein AABZ65_02115 [Candidatus Omnitrophota bacterium]